MKKLQLALYMALVILPACETTRPLDVSGTSSVIRVECKNEASLRQTVMQVIRSCKAYDIVVNDDGGCVIIQASYYDADVPNGRLGVIKEMLDEMAGVIRVEIRENHSVIRQSFYKL
jgi:hypothetical protein